MFPNAENPTSFEEPSSSGESPTQDLENAPSADQTSEEAQAILDLESVQKFRFGGREWTPKEFNNAYLMQQDYTKKTQALSEERKYYENLPLDLEKVRSNPSLIAQFKSIYPKAFHRYVENIKAASDPAQSANQTAQNQAPGMDPKLLERLDKLEGSVTAYEEQRQAAADAEVSANCEKYSKVYPSVTGRYETMAIDLLTARLEEKRNTDPRAKLTAEDWDAAYKSVHQENQKLAEQFYAEKVKEQKNKNQQNKDVATGGGIPGQAPKRPKNIREASEFARQELMGS